MGYWITKFDTTTLSAVSPMQDVGVPAANAPGIETIGGAVDALGSDTARVSLPYRLTVRAEDVQQSLAAMKTAYYATRSMYGKRAKLYRTPDGTSTASEWVYARLVGIQAQRDGETQLAVPYTLVFDVYSHVWSGTTQTATAAMDTSGAVSVACRNNGNAEVRNPVITITAGTAALTSVTLTANSETALTWAGTLAAEKALVIDCGARTVRNDGADAYSGLTYGAAHAVSYWVGLGATATTTLSITHTGGVTGNVSVTFYDGWV